MNKVRVQIGFAIGYSKTHIWIWFLFIVLQDDTTDLSSNEHKSTNFHLFCLIKQSRISFRCCGKFPLMCCLARCGKSHFLVYCVHLCEDIMMKDFRRIKDLQNNHEEIDGSGNGDSWDILRRLRDGCDKYYECAFMLMFLRNLCTYIHDTEWLFVHTLW